MGKREFSLSVYTYSINCCLGALYFGYEMGIYNGLQELIAKEYNLKSEGNQIIEGLITSAIPFGAIFGSVLSVHLLKIGRRKSLIICDGLSFLGIFLSVIPGITPLVIGRLICGIGVGLNSVLVPVYINEISPIEISGTTGSFNQFSICVGILVSFLVCLGLPNSEEISIDSESYKLWRAMLLFASIPVFLRTFILVLFYKYETPPFNCLANNRHEAEKFLLNIYCQNREKTEERLALLERINSEKKNSELAFKSLFGENYLNRTILSVLLAISQQTSGINAVVFYSNKIFKSTMSSKMAVLFTIFSGVIMALTAIISGFIIDETGRRSLWLKGQFCCSLTLGLLSCFKILGLDYLNSYVILLFIFSFGISIGPILSVYLSEILPEKGMSLACGFGWGTAFFIGLLFPKMIDSPLKLEGTFLLFSLITYAFLVWFYFKMVETKGKTREEVSLLFEKVKNDDGEEENAFLVNSGPGSKD